MAERLCSACSTAKGKEAFSKKQWGVSEAQRRCKDCVDSGSGVGSQASPPKPEAETDAKRAVSPPVARFAKEDEPSVERSPGPDRADDASGTNAAPRQQGGSSSGVVDGYDGAVVAAEAAESTAGGGDTAAQSEAATKAAANKKKREKQKAAKQRAAEGGAPSAGSLPSKIDLANLVVQQVAIDDYLRGEPASSATAARRTAMWFAAYWKGFEAEHTWMEARGQSTSRAMGLGPEKLLRLVFDDEPGSGLKRLCFVARAGGADADACAYATVDTDSKPGSVNHIRMVLVDPVCQRQGVGLVVLKAITKHFRKSHLGLKFCNSQDYEKLYGKAGFAKIGCDELYFYMARRVIQK